MLSIRPVELHVLLALTAGPMHGYALVRRIEDDSEGRLRVLPGNLYTVIRRLEAEGLVRESTAKPPSGLGPLRKGMPMAWACRPNFSWGSSLSSALKYQVPDRSGRSWACIVLGRNRARPRSGENGKQKTEA